MTTNIQQAATWLDESQQIAVGLAAEWFRARKIDPKVPQIFRIGGPAGSGKTTIIREILALFPNDEIIVTTLSGKASQVLRDKGIANAINLHQIFYTPIPELISRAHELERMLARCSDADVAKHLRRDLVETKRAMFERRTELDAACIVVDEASMVSGPVAGDLRRYGVPILAVGDPNQLPPVERDLALPALFADQIPDVLLTENHRSGGRADIAAAADAARAGLALPDSVILEKQPPLTEYDMILVWTNKSRWSLTKKLRKQRKLPTTPVPGDRVIVWRNSSAFQVFNGTTFTIEEIDDHEEPDQYWVKTTDGDYYPIYKAGFRDKISLEELGRMRNDRITGVIATFGDVLTVHKGQGSEWDRVLVAEHPSWQMSKDDQRRWRYTAVTRARESVHVVGSAFRNPV